LEIENYKKSYALSAPLTSFLGYNCAKLCSNTDNEILIFSL
jgi:hypothetical protein